MSLANGQVPIRFAVTETGNTHIICSVSILHTDYVNWTVENPSIFEFRKRPFEIVKDFNAVFIVPTGIDAAVGGHAGDAGYVARLLAQHCDNLIVNPNVVNASDINELPENGLYVEGSVISKLLMGTVGLRKVRSNRILLVLDHHEDENIISHSVNAMNAAKVTLGTEGSYIRVQEPLDISSEFSSNGCAVGLIRNIEPLFQLLHHAPSSGFDAIALSTIIKVPEEFHKTYYSTKMVNPWGGVEAMLSHAVSMEFGLPTAHSPMIESQAILNEIVGVVDPRQAAEVISTAYLHCVLKGLHKSPQIVTNIDEEHDDYVDNVNHADILSAKNISCLIIPNNCIGLPTLAAIQQDIPIIMVTENKNLMKNDITILDIPVKNLFVVGNYAEAAGVMAALKAGVNVHKYSRG